MERQVALMKWVLNKKLEKATVTFNELLTLTAETAKILNGKLLNYITADEDLNYLRVITPLDLLGGRDVQGLCVLDTGGRDKITRH